MKTTPLTAVHRELDAQMADFAGYDMPIVYTSIQEEHEQVRTRVGLFDLSHMGRLEIEGPDRLSWFDGLVTNRVTDMTPGMARYGLFCLPDGGVLDDLIYYTLEDRLFVVVNAANRQACLDWMAERRRDADVTVRDRSAEMAMLALQGPESEALLQPLVEEVDLGELDYYSIATGLVANQETRFARTGYTGEDGFELYFPAEAAVTVWKQIRDRDVPPIGLGARDTLRTEAAMPLYGHELSRSINPLEAGLRFAVKFEGKGDYVGRDVLQRIKEEGPARKLVCLEVDGRRIPRHEAEIYEVDAPEEAEPVGFVTSGTFSPTLQKPIALGLVPRAKGSVGHRFEADVRGRRIPLEVVKRPFYKRKSKT